MMRITPDCVGAVMDVVVWLRSLGLGKYEATFRENEIDETVLPSLTEEHLKQLGVTALGHRVKLLDAIAALRNDASGRAPPGDAATTSSAPSAHPEDRAERRQVTVMFSDLIGSQLPVQRMGIRRSPSSPTSRRSRLQRRLWRPSSFPGWTASSGERPSSAYRRAPPIRGCMSPPP